MAEEDPDLAHLLRWGDLLDSVSYYDLLGVVDNADEGTIRRAFHDFALAFHPDGHLHREPETRAGALRVYQRGVEAYRVLGRPELRARYDRQLATGRLRLDENLRDEPPSDAGATTQPAAPGAPAAAAPPAADPAAARGETPDGPVRTSTPERCAPASTHATDAEWLDELPTRLPPRP